MHGSRGWPNWFPRPLPTVRAPPRGWRGSRPGPPWHARLHWRPAPRLNASGLPAPRSIAGVDRASIVISRGKHRMTSALRRINVMTLFAAGMALAAAGCSRDAGSDGGESKGGVDAARITAAAPDQWLSTGRTYDEQRFSPLDAINTGDVGKLGLAWSADLDTARGQEATPLFVDGALYVSTAWSMVKAYDGQTGKLLWSYDPEVPRETLVKTCCDAVNRGVAAWGDKLFVGTLDGRLVALDRATGKPVWSVITVDQSKAYTITG